MIHLWTSPEINRPDFYHYDLLRQLGLVLNVAPSHRHGGGQGVHVLMVLARWLFLNQDWFKSLDGPRVIVEHDAYLNFMPESPYCQCWTKLYRNCNFDLIISSGRETTNRLREEGLPAVWVPKGCNAEFLQVPNTGTRAFGYFSCPIAEQETGREFHFYRSRHEMGKYLEGVVPPIACPFGEFPRTVADYCAVVTNDHTMGEPMAKQFECSALGCAVIRDRQDELYDLGYVEGESVVTYESFGEMMDIIDHYNDHIEDLMAIGRNAREVARNHTWRHRAEQIAAWVRPYVRGKIYV